MRQKITKEVISKALKLFRISFATCLICVSLWALFLPPLFPHSSHAVVNASLVTIKARDGGVVSGLSPSGPTTVDIGSSIARVTRDLLKIQRNVEQNKVDHLKLQEKLKNLDALLADREQALADTQSLAQKTRDDELEIAELTQSKTREKVRVAREALQMNRASESRIEPLFKDGIVTSAQWAETRTQTLDAEKNLNLAELELTTLESNSAQLRSGGGGTTSSSTGGWALIMTLEQEARSLRMQRQELQAELDAERKQIAAIESHNEADRSYKLTTPIKGIIWRRHAVNGESLHEGQNVADVADTQTIFVEAFFRQDFMNSIAVGDKASIQLIPGTKIIRGRVADIQVQESAPKGANTINTMTLGGWMLRVVIDVDAHLLEGENIGQMAKVLISKEGDSLLNQSSIWVTLALRGHQ